MARVLADGRQPSVTSPAVWTPPGSSKSNGRKAPPAQAAPGRQSPKPNQNIRLARVFVDDGRPGTKSSFAMRAMMRDVWEIFGLNRFRVGSDIYRWDPKRDVMEIEAGAALNRSGKRGRNGRKSFRTIVLLSGKIKGSFYHSVLRAGGDGRLALALAEIFSWRVDFTNLQLGDTFSIIAEQWIRGTRKPRWGRILAAELKTGRYNNRAFGFPSLGGQLRYFDPDGKSLHNNFLRSPLNYTRISSKFSYRRLHPILKVYRPHRGIDLAAPRGTPVRSVAAGRVMKVGWSGEGGKTVELRHKEGLTTRYHHLSRYAKGLRAGLFLPQGKVIGYVGTTGLSTGPHLDFRVLRNGRPINPQLLKYAAGEPLSSGDRKRFLRIRNALSVQLRGIIRQLEARAGTNMVAARASGR